MWMERLTSICANCVFEEPADPSDLADLIDALLPEMPEDLCTLLAEANGVCYRMVVDPNAAIEEGVITMGLVSNTQDIWDDTNRYRSIDAAFNDSIMFGSMPNGDFLAYRYTSSGEAPDVWVISHENYDDRTRFAPTLDVALRIILECAIADV